MKIIIYALLLIACEFLTSCFFMRDERTLITKSLSNGERIEVYYVGYGATTSDVIWIAKINNNKRNIVGKIKDFDFTFKINLNQINDSIIRLRFTDTTNFTGIYNDFFINLNNRIEPNDGSPYNENNVIHKTK